MDKLMVIAASCVTEADVAEARLGSRYGRLDRPSRVAVLAVELLKIDFDSERRDRIAVCLASRAGCITTDLEYWAGRDAVGGPSPTLFTYTLPSAPMGEIAIRHRLTGPNLCLVGRTGRILVEAQDFIRRGEADGCICVACDCVPEVETQPVQSAIRMLGCALFLKRSGAGLQELGEIDRDIESLCDILCARKSAS